MSDPIKDIITKAQMGSAHILGSVNGIRVDHTLVGYRVTMYIDRKDYAYVDYDKAQYENLIKYLQERKRL